MDSSIFISFENVVRLTKFDISFYFQKATSKPACKSIITNVPLTKEIFFRLILNTKYG